MSDGQKKKYIEMFGSFTEPFKWLLSFTKIMLRILNFNVSH